MLFPNNLFTFHSRPLDKNNVLIDWINSNTHSDSENQVHRVSFHSNLEEFSSQLDVNKEIDRDITLILQTLCSKFIIDHSEEFKRETQKIKVLLKLFLLLKAGEIKVTIDNKEYSINEFDIKYSYLASLLSHGKRILFMFEGNSTEFIELLQWLSLDFSKKKQEIYYQRKSTHSITMNKNNKIIEIKKLFSYQTTYGMNFSFGGLGNCHSKDNCDGLKQKNKYSQDLYIFPSGKRYCSQTKQIIPKIQHGHLIVVPKIFEKSLIHGLLVGIEGSSPLKTSLFDIHSISGKPNEKSVNGGLKRATFFKNLQIKHKKIKDLILIPSEFNGIKVQINKDILKHVEMVFDLLETKHSSNQYITIIKDLLSTNDTFDQFANKHSLV